MKIDSTDLWCIIMAALTFALLVVVVISSAAGAKTYEAYIAYHDVEGRIGVRISLDGHVSRVHAHSPAAKAGIQKGDQIVRVDGKLKNVEHISGAPETYVTLDVRHKGCTSRYVVKRIDYREIEP